MFAVSYNCPRCKQRVTVRFNKYEIKHTKYLITDKTWLCPTSHCNRWMEISSDMVNNLRVQVRNHELSS